MNQKRFRLTHSLCLTLLTILHIHGSFWCTTLIVRKITTVKIKKKVIEKNYSVFLSSKFTANGNVQTFWGAFRDSKSGPVLSLKCNHDVRNVPKYQGMFKWLLQIFSENIMKVESFRLKLWRLNAREGHTCYTSKSSECYQNFSGRNGNLSNG